MDCSPTSPVLPHNNLFLAAGQSQQDISPSVDSLTDKVSEMTLSQSVTHATLVTELKKKLSQRNVNIGSTLLRLPIDALGVISSHLPEVSDINPLFQSCASAFLIKPELLARDPFKASQFISACCNNTNLQQLKDFLSECKSTSFASTKLYLSLDGFWDDLPEALQLVQTKFPALVCLDFTPEKEKTACKPWAVETINRIVSVCPQVNQILLREITPTEVTKITLPPILTEIEFQGMHIDTTILSHYLQNAEQLRALTFENCQISKNTLEIPKNKIQKVTLTNTNLDSETLRLLLSAFESLIELELINCKNISSDSLALIKSSGIKKLNISNSMINDQLLTEICKNCRGLEELNLFGCSQITTKTFQTLIYPPELHVLTVSWTEIDDQGLYNVLGHCSNLREFSVGNCKKLTANSFQTAPWPSTLQRLEVQGTSFSDKALTHCQSMCPYLSTVNR